MKLFQLAVVFLIAAAVLAGTRALAGKWKSRDVILTCMVTEPTDPDYGASGVATVTQQYWWWDSMTGYTESAGEMTVSCRRLTPGVTYTVSGFNSPIAFTPKRSGQGSVTGYYFWGLNVGEDVTVQVIREGGTVVLEGIVWGN
jgi:hypothetical protein